MSPADGSVAKNTVQPGAATVGISRGRHGRVPPIRHLLSTTVAARLALDGRPVKIRPKNLIPRGPAPAIREHPAMSASSWPFVTAVRPRAIARGVGWEQMKHGALLGIFVVLRDAAQPQSTNNTPASAEPHHHDQHCPPAFLPRRSVPNAEGVVCVRTAASTRCPAAERSLRSRGCSTRTEKSMSTTRRI